MNESQQPVVNQELSPLQSFPVHINNSNSDGEDDQVQQETMMHPHYRYNHYPRRSSSSYSSKNISSYSSSIPPLPSYYHGNSSMELNNMKLSSCSPTASTASTSTDAPSDPSSSPSSQKQARDNNSSFGEALSLYQAFAAISDAPHNTKHDVCNENVDYEQQWATNDTSFDDTLSSTNYIGDVQEECQSEANASTSKDTGDCPSLSDGNNSDSENDNSNTSQAGEGGETTIPLNDVANNPGPDENDSDESTTSWSSYLSPTNSQSSSNNSTNDATSFLYRHRKKVASLSIMASVWLYTQYQKSKHHNQWKNHHLLANGRRRNGRNNNLHGIQRHMKLLSVYQWMLQLLSPLRISKLLQRILASIKLASMRSLQSISKPLQSTASSKSPAASSLLAATSQPWNNATSAPLSHLLAMAKAGNVTKVMLRGSVLSYLHSTQSPTLSISNNNSPPAAVSSPTKKQRWSQTTLPTQNQNVLNEIISTLLQNGCDDITTLPESLFKRFLNGPAVMILPFAYLGALYWMMRRLQRQQFEQDDNDGNGYSWNGQGEAPFRHTTTFDDVAGIDSSLQELSELISYMRNPSSFHSVGAQPPRGILLHGPPGSGKTLLARAIAGEAERNVDGIHQMGGNRIDCFVVCSGSEFVETYVGRGAARVRTLFRNVREEATRNFRRRKKTTHFKRWNTVSTEDGIKSRGMVTRAMSDAWEGVQSLVSSSNGGNATEQGSHNKPMAIIFIDEIDALAKRRDSGMGLPSSLGGGGCDEREQTLNQLLTEMDGFATGGPASQVNVIVIAATNRPEVLDPAIMRPGRFDRHVQVSLPDAKGREAILRVHARRIRWDQSSVNFGELLTDRMSGADLKNVVNEAALLAVRSGSSKVKQSHLLEAVQKVRAMTNCYGRPRDPHYVNIHMRR